MSKVAAASVPAPSVSAASAVSAAPVKAKIILVDMDGVTADLDAELVRTLRERKQNNVAAAIVDRKEFEYDAAVDAACKKVMAEQGFYDRLPPIQDAVACIKAMAAAGHHVWFCTSPLKEYKYCVAEKYAWVERHLERSGRVA